MDEFEELTVTLGDDSVTYFQRVSAVRALVRLGEARAVEPLVAALQDPEKYVRREVVLGLGQLGDVQAVPPLVDLLPDDDDEQTRRNVVKVLGEFPDERALAAVRGALEDTSWSVRYAAKEAAGKLAKAIAAKAEEETAEVEPTDVEEDRLAAAEADESATPDAAAPDVAESASASAGPAEDAPRLRPPAERRRESEPAAAEPQPPEVEPEPGPQPSSEEAAPAPEKEADATPDARIEWLLDTVLRPSEAVRTVVRSSRDAKGAPGESWLVVTDLRVIIVTRNAAAELSFDAFGLKDVVGSELQYFTPEAADEFGMHFFWLTGAPAVASVAFAMEERSDFEAADELIRAAREAVAPGAAAHPALARASGAPARQAAPAIPTLAAPSGAMVSLSLKRGFHAPGQVVKGVVVVETDIPVAARGVRLAVRGVEKVAVQKGGTQQMSKRAIIDRELTLWGDEKASFTENVADAVLTLFGQADHREIPAGTHRHPFEFKLPAGALPTYRGTNIEVRYDLRAYVDIPAAFDAAYTCRLQVAPHKPKSEARHADLGRLRAPGKKIALSAAIEEGDWVADAMLRGSVSLENPTWHAVRAIVISLVCEEQAAGKSLQKGARWRFATRKSQRRINLKSGQTSIRDKAFALRIPPVPWPFAGDLSRVTWFVEVRADVALGLDAKVKVPIRLK